MKKIFCCILFCFITLICFINASKTGLTMAEKDGYILFSYSLNDAMNKSDKTMSKKVEGGTTTYNFKDHVLSCGTHMTGIIKRTESKDKIIYLSNFTVDKNDYKITSLEVDYNETTKSPIKRSGKIKINGKDYDINLFF